MGNPDRPANDAAKLVLMERRRSPRGAIPVEVGEGVPRVKVDDFAHFFDQQLVFG
jgi:hypothetical protein